MSTKTTTLSRTPLRRPPRRPPPARHPPSARDGTLSKAAEEQFGQKLVAMSMRVRKAMADRQAFAAISSAKNMIMAEKLAQQHQPPSERAGMRPAMMVQKRGRDMDDDDDDN